ncbi:hypothetical protein ACWGE0_42920 [Lentzea sp. NPDC054927]
MGNLVLFAELRKRLDDHLDLVQRVAIDGDATSALPIMRREVPGLVAALRELVEEHLPDENGSCAKCRSGPFWRRVSVPCRMLLKVHLALGAAEATTRDRTCWSTRRHRLRQSSED